MFRDLPPSSDGQQDTQLLKDLESIVLGITGGDIKKAPEVYMALLRLPVTSELASLLNQIRELPDGHERLKAWSLAQEK